MAARTIIEALAKEKNVNWDKDTLIEVMSDFIDSLGDLCLQDFREFVAQEVELEAEHNKTHKD